QAEVVVRAKVLSAGTAGLFEPGAPSSPYTPLNVQVLEVLSGDMELGAQTLYFPGGAVTAEEYLSKNPTSGQKIGLAELSQSERKSKYLQFTSETDFDIKKNTEYVFVLGQDVEKVAPDLFFVYVGAYGTFTKDKKNVKTQKELKSTNAGKAKVQTEVNAAAN
ncbi:MAG: hypothetical protein LBT21_02675, partial [Oscillospiraceae bacterium]|nr:hypothetical protein [Oscillospiraceae bacterium]